jgi:hypothetical protein
MRMRTRRSGAGGDGAMAVAGKRVRRLAGVLLLAAAPVAGQSPPATPDAYALSSGGRLYVGNGTRVIAKVPAADPTAPARDVPAPIAAGGPLVLDERTLVGDVVARGDATMRLLAEVRGDLLVTEGDVRLSNQAHVTGALTAGGDVVVGLGANVGGALVARRGRVNVGRLARVAGDVFAGGEFHGERDVVVGAPGTTVEVRGATTLRDRGEYFATIVHEGAFTLVGGTPLLHAPVVAVAPGTLATPVMPDWRLDPLVLPDVDAPAGDVVVDRRPGGVTLPPGRYGRLLLVQQAVLRLAAGVYEIDGLVAQSDARLVVDVADPAARVEVRARHDVRPGRRFVVDLETADPGVRRTRASRILTTTGGSFRGASDVVWAGAVAAARGFALGRHATLLGTAWAHDRVDVGRDGTIVWLLPSP